MAACKSVVVLCPNARRQTVKVGPTTTILQILEEVCKKQGLSSQENAIKHQKKILDETLPIRYSGLSNNAHLEIVPQKKTTKIDAQCTIALQLASGQRLMKDFPPAHSLWDVIQHWNSQQDSPHHQKLLGEEGKDVVCVYLTQRISGEHTLKSTTLHSLGFTGKRAIIRLLHEEATSSNPKPLVSEPASSSSQHQETLSEPCQIPATVTIPGNMDTAPSTSQEGLSEPCQTPATVTIPGNMDTAPSTIHEGLSEPCQIPAQHDTKSQGQPSKVDKPTEDRHRQLDTKTVSPDRAARDPKRTRIAGPDPIFPDFKFPDRSATDVSNPQAPIVTEERLHYLATPCERCPVVFKENDETIAVPNQDVPDSFYDVTVEDIRKMLHNLQSERTKSGDMPLLTKAMRESRKLQEICKYERVVIRVKFPDRLILQGFFRPQEKVSVLTEFVKSHLEDPNESFYLYTAPPKTVLQKQDDTLYDAQLCPASFVHFGSKEKKDHFLASQLLGNLATALDAEKTVLGSGICGSSAPSTTEPSTIQTATNINTSTNNKNTKTISNSATVPPPGASSGKVPKWFKAQ